MVSVEGSETEQQRVRDESGSRGLVLALLGLIAGLILGVLFTGGSADETESGAGTVVGEPDQPPPTPLSTTTTQVAASRLATIVPGMLDTMVTAAVDRTGVSVVTAWEPADGAPAIRTLPYGDLVADVSREWLALAEPSRYTDRQTLWVGNEAYMEPVASPMVGSPIWHSRLPGMLAWVEDTASGPVVRGGRFVAGQTMVPADMASVLPGTAIVWWTDTGIVTLDIGGSLSLHGDDGTVRASRQIDRVVAAGPELIAVTTSADAPLLLDQSLEAVGVAPWSAACERGSFGPRGRELVVLCPDPEGERFEYWQDTVAQDRPVFTLTDTDLTDAGFTSSGIPYVAAVDSLRPATAITFYSLTENREYVLSYPGRAMWVETMRG